MEHDGGASVLPFLVLALGCGAAIRHFLRRTPFPYTVALLVLGLIFGFTNDWMIHNWPEIGLGASIKAASSVDPHLILFIFLPTLIFESAFSMDTHVFRKTSFQVFLLAVPGLILTTLCVAAFAKYFFPADWAWDWKTALMFGAIVSATDPVAVVALLREMGAGKQLATLIEGESLFNDGTAIVVFLVFFEAITTGASTVPSEVAKEFLWVSFAGPFVGVLIAGATVVWIRHVFNDALVEITVTIVAAYVTYNLAEFLHVSGVLAVVALGLMLAGIGRTSISPEVEGFLHRFWQMMAYLLNTLIFILVGLVIAINANVSDGKSWIILLVLYVAVHVIRALVILVFFPIMRKHGYGLTWREGTVIMWGGLRGAVGLCLALLVAQNDVIPESVRVQILFLCAGIVVLTLVINGTTIGTLLHILGMDKVLPARMMMLSAAATRVQANMDATVDLLKRDRFLSGADWERVRAYLPDINVPVSESEQEKTDQFDLAAEARRRILEAEKRSYWKQYNEGLLGSDAVRRLVESVDNALDQHTRLDERKDLQKIWQFSPLIRQLNRWLKSLPVIGNSFRSLFFGHLALSYDVARGFVYSQEEIGGLIEGIVDDVELKDMIKKEGSNNRKHALTALKNLREAFPEITVAIETKTAVRSVLYQERSSVKKLLSDGALDEAEAHRFVEVIETQMKLVLDAPPSIELPEPHQLLREIPWLTALDAPTLQRVQDSTKNLVYAPGEILIKEGDPSDSLCVIIRGTVKVSRRTDEGELFLDFMGPGSVIGEMGVLTGLKRTATVQSETPANALWIYAADLRKIMKDSPDMDKRLWQTAGARFAENFLIGKTPYNSWGQLKLRRWLLNGKLIAPGEGELQRLAGPAVLLRGEAVITDDGVKILSPPIVLEPALVTFRNDARVFICPSSEVGPDDPHWSD